MKILEIFMAMLAGSLSALAASGLFELWRIIRNAERRQRVFSKGFRHAVNVILYK